MVREHWVSLRQYADAVFRHWWAIGVSFLGGLLGIVSSFHPIVVPLGLWVGVCAGGLLVAQFRAFHDLRLQRDSLLPGAKPLTLYGQLALFHRSFTLTRAGLQDGDPSAVSRLEEDTENVRRCLASRRREFLSVWEQHVKRSEDPPAAVDFRLQALDEIMQRLGRDDQ